jgi:arsenite oxidase small subunit
MTDRDCDPAAGVVSRRNFLKLGGATVVTVTLPVFLHKAGLPITLQAQQVEYPRQTIGRLSELSTGQTVRFNYPWDHPAATNFLIRLNEPAGGGVGLDQDVVAFNSFCPHQGGSLTEQFHDDIGVAGPCPLH